MISLSAAMQFAENHMDENKRLIIATGHLLPAQFIATYRKTLASQDRVPAKTNRLRRSVRYQVLGNTASVMWYAPYAAAQEAGQARGRVFRNYTKPGTGRGFGQMALAETRASFMRDFAVAHPEYGL